MFFNGNLPKFADEEIQCCIFVCFDVALDMWVIGSFVGIGYGGGV